MDDAGQKFEIEKARLADARALLAIHGFTITTFADFVGTTHTIVYTTIKKYWQNAEKFPRGEKTLKILEKLYNLEKEPLKKDVPYPVYRKRLVDLRERHKGAFENAAREFGLTLKP